MSIVNLNNFTYILNNSKVAIEYIEYEIRAPVRKNDPSHKHPVNSEIVFPLKQKMAKELPRQNYRYEVVPRVLEVFPPGRGVV
jgi:hypothetical protein